MAAVEMDRVMTAAAPQDQELSLSESLAHGLVSRLTTTAREAAVSQRQAVATPGATLKRAAAYRAQCGATLERIPKSLRAWHHDSDPSGKDKNAVCRVFHWASAEEFEQRVADGTSKRNELLLLHTVVSSKARSTFCRPVGTVTRHALMRLFYRLKTASESVVLAELSQLCQMVFINVEVLGMLSPDAELLVPTGAGAFVLAVDAGRPSEFVVKTFLSDRRMEDNTGRLQAVRAARSEFGVVVNHAPSFAIISKKRTGAHGHLPGAAGLNALCDEGMADRDKLPWSWRFRPRNEAARAGGDQSAVALQRA